MSAEYVCFDIETTGLLAGDKVVSYCLLEGGGDTASAYGADEKEILEQLSVDVKQVAGWILVTYNGENWHGGFDVPFLRTRYLLNGMMDLYPFRGMWHIDLLPIVQKRFNTTVSENPRLEDLSAAELRELGKPKLTKAENIKWIRDNDPTMEKVQKFMVENDKWKIVSRNGLKYVSGLFFGTEIGMTGEDVPALAEAGEYELIHEYNVEDCRKTQKLLEVCQAMCPRYEMKAHAL